MIYRLLNQKGYKRFLLYAVPIMVYGVIIYGLNRLMMPHITWWSVLGFEVFFVAICFGFKYLLDVLFSPKYWYIGCSLMVLFAFSVSVAAYYYLYRVMPSLGMRITRPHVAFNEREFIQNCLLGLLRAGIYGLLYFVLKRYKKEAKEKIDALEKAVNAERHARKVQEELNGMITMVLTAQINPHFCRNAFTLLEAMAVARGYWDMVEVIQDLSTLMSYLAGHAAEFEQLIYVKKELHQVELFAKLIRKQKGADEAVRLITDGKPFSLTIPPMVLLTLLENAYKYGDISVKHPLEVTVQWQHNAVVFSCRNRKKQGKVRQQTSSSKIGLQNITHRLNLLRPGRFDLAIDDGAEFFTVALYLNK